MRRYSVLTDSTCDLSDDTLRANHIDLVCFKLALDGVGYTERVDFTPDQFCGMLRKASGLPMTSQITQPEFLDKFESYAADGVEDVLYVSINAGGSSTNASAQEAAKQFHDEHPDSSMRIFIVNSRAYSMAQGAPIVGACEKLAQGETMEEVVTWLEDRYARMEILLTAFTLKVIRKSGRISAAAAIAGDILGIHPIFTLNDGQSTVVQKIRGDKRVFGSMAAVMKKRMRPGTPYYIGISDEKYTEESKTACMEAIGYPPAEVFHLGAAVLSNTGADAVGFVYEGEFRSKPDAE